MIHSRQGFTLIELLIVVALAAVLVAILLPGYQDLTPEAKITSTQANLQTMRSAVALYAGRMGGLPANLDSLVSKGFLRKIPKEMINNSDNVTVNPSKDPHFNGGWIYFSNTGDVRVNVDRKSLEILIPGTQVDPYEDW